MVSDTFFALKLSLLYWLYNSIGPDILDDDSGFRDVTSAVVGTDGLVCLQAATDNKTYSV